MENSEERIRVLSETEILVNLDAPPKLPFNGAKIEKNSGGGWVKVEKREDGLYVDGYKVTLYLSEQQKGERAIRGSKLREELLGKPVLHPNILDVLPEYSDFIPKDWKNGKSENNCRIFFWGIIFRGFDGFLCVRYLGFLDGECGWFYRQLDSDWDSDSHAALLEISS